MKEFIYEKLHILLKNEYKSLSLFAKITDTSYDIFFLINDTEESMQCYELCEMGKLDENEVDKCFLEIAKEYRLCDDFVKNKINIITFIMEEGILNYDICTYENNESIFKIKNEWISRYRK